MPVNKMAVKAAITIMALLTLLVLYLQFGDPDVSFQSSDGKWADSEVQFKGRHFKDIAIYFEAYKIKCGASSAALIRTTPIHWSDVFAWPSYIRDKKWNVPYGAPNPKIGEYYEPACASMGWSDDVFKKAQADALAYLNQL